MYCLHLKTLRNVNKLCEYKKSWHSAAANYELKKIRPKIFLWNIVCFAYFQFYLSTLKLCEQKFWRNFRHFLKDEIHEFFRKTIYFNIRGEGMSFNACCTRRREGGEWKIKNQKTRMFNKFIVHPFFSFYTKFIYIPLKIALNIRGNDYSWKYNPCKRILVK